MFLWPSWIISGCCMTHLITVARIQTKEGMWFTANCPVKIWVWVAHCIHIKNWSDQTPALQSSTSPSHQRFIKNGLKGQSWWRLTASDDTCCCVCAWLILMIPVAVFVLDWFWWYQLLCLWLTDSDDTSCCVCDWLIPMTPVDMFVIDWFWWCLLLCFTVCA